VLNNKVIAWAKNEKSFEITKTIARDSRFPLEHFAQKPELLEELF